MAILPCQPLCLVTTEKYLLGSFTDPQLATGTTDMGDIYGRSVPLALQHAQLNIL